MYCSYNVRLFKPFTSMKTKIIPALADDWIIQTGSYNTTGGFILYSKKLNQRVADIELRRFLDFSEKYKLVIDSLKLQGEYVIGNDRSVYTREMYDTWKEKFDERVDKIIEKKDLIRGHRYETPCGSRFIYLGRYQTINFKDKLEAGKLVLTKMKSVHMITDISGHGTHALNQKVRRDEGFIEGWNEKKIEKVLEDYRILSHVAYLDTAKLKTPTITLREDKTEKTWSYNSYRFTFAEIEYKGTSMVVTNLWSSSSGGSNSVIDYNASHNEEMRRYERNISEGYKTSKPEQFVFGKKLKVDDLMVFDPVTCLFDRKTLESKDREYSYSRRFNGDKYVEVQKKLNTLCCRR